jgi:hypothetical protein
MLVALLAASGTRMKGASKAPLWSSAVGFGFGLQAAVAKTFVGELRTGARSLLADRSLAGSGGGHLRICLNRSGGRRGLHRSLGSGRRAHRFGADGRWRYPLSCSVDGKWLPPPIRGSDRVGSAGSARLGTA